MKTGSWQIIGLAIGLAMTGIAPAQSAGGTPVRNAVGARMPTPAGAGATGSSQGISGTATVRPAAGAGMVGGSSKSTGGVLNGSGVRQKHP